MAPAKKSTELAPWDEPESVSGLAAIEPTQDLVRQAYKAIVDKTLPPEIGDPKITARLIMERIQTGSLEDSMSATAKLPAWGDLYKERVVTVVGFHLNPSTFADEDGNKGVYAVVEIADPTTSELVTVQVGGGNVLMQLVKAWEERKYPFQAVLVGRATGTPGRETYWLKTPTAAAAA